MSLAMLLHQANDQYINGKMEESIATLDLLISMGIASSDIYCNRGVAYSALDRFDEAVADLEHALQLDETNFLAHHNLGAAYIELDEYDKALRHLSKAIDLNPEFGSSYLLRGIARYKVEDHGDAYFDFVAAIEKEPGLLPAYLYAGELCSGSGLRDEAIQYYTSIIVIVSHADSSHLEKEDYLLAIQAEEGLVALGYTETSFTQQALMSGKVTMEDITFYLEDE